ncbi:putative toxin-antitoxin system toxin component, PIN family [Algiphilus sp. W345]|uniref:Toxin-antitoxin system toxin component, PIN family n=1 Tax=Banduia mediterranea TaxID=3075609 RepID=A0ABU2WIC7_9GAMM|nr:putative toxin-antitoxin system toxin component, PIN family [Algiphilus sp. W345]MDT0497625.1 putative toxin-antitoxin system toxin component, PIN family [Algiphilus sp. W345]
MQQRIVIDTSVLIAALIGRTGPAREILRGCLTGRYRLLIGNALFSEYEDVPSRPDIRRSCPLDSLEIRSLLNALYSTSEWVSIYFLWRPNLRDEGDNHLIELAVAGQAQWLITNNLRNLARGELKFADINVVTPEALLKR